jgi:murein DD-endopeptidase MepM/ murein hydrolase activator NlpD
LWPALEKNRAHSFFPIFAPKMSQEDKEKPRQGSRWRHKYRLVVVNEVTFEEKASFRLSRLNVFSLVGFAFMFVIAITVLVMAFTPVREIIPGYSDADVRSLGFQNNERATDIEDQFNTDKVYMDNILRILKGEAADDSIYLNDQTIGNYDTVKLSGSEKDSAFRAALEESDRYNIEGNVLESNASMAGVFFFTPVRGQISQSFAPEVEHFGIDVVANQNATIKSTLAGTVIFAEWTTDNGYVMYIQHEHNLISVYKHNSKLMKKVGDRVKAGDSVAIIGDTGESSEGPHLHFELWQDGKALDPQALIVFK